MPLLQRPFSLNNYALSKVWFKCGSIDVRESDIKMIMSKAKSFLYADQFEKPEEIVLYRATQDGGLNLVNIWCKAIALLIRSFLETAGNPQFLSNLFHTTLF